MASIDLTSPCKLVAVQMPYSHFHWFCHILSGKDLGQEGSGAGEYFDRFGGPRDEDGRRVLEEVGREIQHLMADERHGQLRRRHVRLLRKTSRFDSVACLASMYGFSMLAFFLGFIKFYWVPSTSYAIFTILPSLVGFYWVFLFDWPHWRAFRRCQATIRWLVYCHRICRPASAQWTCSSQRWFCRVYWRVLEGKATYRYSSIA